MVSIIVGHSFDVRVLDPCDVAVAIRQTGVSQGVGSCWQSFKQSSLKCIPSNRTRNLAPGPERYTCIY